MINTFRTLFEARERKFQQERLFRGESVDLVARITTDGVMDTLSGYSISGVYQPVGDDPEGLTYTLDAEISDGKAILHWTDENDFGKTAYNVWGLLTKDGKAAYPIAWRLNFANSPSYPIDEINPLVRTIDFDKYDLLNAPWVPLSGGVMDQDAMIAFPIDENAWIKVGKDGFQAVDVTTVETEAMSGWCWWSIPDPVPDYEIQWFTQNDLDNWDEEQRGAVRPDLNPRLRLCATQPATSTTTETETAKYQIPTDEEGDRTFATREWTQENAIDKLDDYLPLSGGTVSGDFAVENFLSSTDRGVFLGKNQDLDQYAELAIGNNLSVGMVGLAMGSNSEARSNDITIGHSAKSPYGGGNIVIGNGASTASVGTTVVGTNAKASAGNAIAIGTAANATHSGEVRLGGPQGNIKPQLWLFETPIISGPDLNIVPERLGWLSDEYATQEWVNEQISSIPQPPPPMPAGILTIKQNETTVAEYNPDDGTSLTATIYVPTVPTDLSDFTNSPGYATETWVEEYVDEHGGGGASGDYLPLSGGEVTGNFAVENFLSAKANDPGYGSSLALGHNTKIAHDGVGAPDQQVGGNLAIGNEVSATGFNTIAIGGEVVGSEKTAATSINSIAIGLAATATKEEAIAIGNYAKAIAKRAIGIGTDISANAYSAIAIGTHAEVKKNYAVQIGEGTNNYGVSCLNYLSANIVEPQNGNLIINPDRLPYLSDYATSSYVDSNIGTINGRIDGVADDLSTNYATKSEIPTDLSSFTNSPGYATSAYVDTKIGDINTILDSVNGQII